MQTKSKQKIKKAEDSSMIKKNSIIEDDFLIKQNMFIEYGAICNDGTFTSKLGQGAGSHHGGIKQIVYIKNIQIQRSSNQKMSSKFSASTNSSILTCPNCQYIQPKQGNKHLNRKQGSQSNKSKKKSLKQSLKTKAKRSGLYQKLYCIFEVYYKDELDIAEEQINDQIWLIISAVSNLYDELAQADETIAALQDELSNKKVRKIPPKAQNPSVIQQVSKVQNQRIKRQNQQLFRQIQKLQIQNAKVRQNLKIYKEKQKNFKKLLRVIEKQNPKVISNALDISQIDSSKTGVKQNKAVTRSVTKKKSKLQQKKVAQSVFSSDSSSDFYDQDNTIRDLVKSLK